MSCRISKVTRGASEPAVAAQVAWVQPDVHSWTPVMQALLKNEFPDLPQITEGYAPMFDDACASIREKYGSTPAVEQVLSKMSMRRAVSDGDLCGVVPAGLLAYVWFEYVEKLNAVECFRHFHDTLSDMAGTCIQGDTHRLFSSLVALKRASKRELL